ncbi:MAG TPA: hypothetical protein VEX39_03500 [Thermoleophilaceae bacterium]|nr:hypothetical protein [Thermoleophilaceae bacterium]
MDLLAAHPENAQRLRDAGYRVETDDNLVKAMAHQIGAGQITVRLVLHGSDDVRTAGPAT